MIAAAGTAGRLRNSMRAATSPGGAALANFLSQHDPHFYTSSPSG
jgi:hypothetical protein